MIEEAALQFDVTTAIDIILMIFLLISALAIVVMRHLFSIAMVSGVYSLLSAAFFVNLDAVDVAFTEAAVGAGMSTILILGALLLTSRREKITPNRSAFIPLIVVVVTGAALFYATFDMPNFADPNSPANTDVGLQYIQRNYDDIGVPNIVTSVLASYRGFDTLGETLVVFAAGLSVLVLLGVSSAGRLTGREDET